MWSIGWVLVVLLSCGTEPWTDGAEPWSDGSCEEVCRGLECEESPTDCLQAASLYGCACDGCAACRPPTGVRLPTAGRQLASGCVNPCFGDAGGCDAFVPLGATCDDLETNEYLKIGRKSCDCTGCSLCDETDTFAPAVDACDGGAGGAAVEMSTEAQLTAALDAGAPCTLVLLVSDVALVEAASMATAVRLDGDGPARRALSATGPHRLVTVRDQAVVSLTTLTLRGGFDAFAGGCVFVAGGSALSLQDVVVEYCSAGAFGGAVAAWGEASVRVSKSSFVGNVAGFMGGSIYGHSRAAVVITDATTIGLSSAFVGGGVTVTTAATLEVSEASRIYGCTTNSNGGGFFLGRFGVATLSSGSDISNCHTGGRGGAIFGHVSSTVVLKGRCAVENCTATVGGGVQSLGGVVTASDCAFVGCVVLASPGGGVLIVGPGSGTFTNVDFRNCASPAGPGGGLAIGSAVSATLADSRFVGCAAGTHGGALATAYAGGAVTLARTAITGCHAAGDGGAMYLSPGCRASIDSSIFSDNAASAYGGAIVVSASSKIAVFGGTRVERNVAARGGGLALLPAATAGFENAAVSQNIAVDGGGGAAFVGAGATLHLGRAALLSRNMAASDGGAVDVRGNDAQLYVSASCSFVQVTLDWMSTSTVDAVEASVLLDYDSAPAGPGRDARGVSARFVPQNGDSTRFEACLPPGRDYELWAASSRGSTWFEGSWSLELPPHGDTAVSFVEARVTFVQAVNEYGVLGIGFDETHGALAAAFYLDDDDDAADAADGIDAVRIVGNVAVAGDGGGVAASEAGRAVVYEALFEANHALAGSGGAVAVEAQSTAELQGVIAVANVAGRDGGAVRVGMLGVVDIYNSTATANHARGRGGFAALDRVRTASLRSVAARGNRAADHGGALALVLCDQDPVVVAGSTFQNNSAALSGGALDVEASSLRVDGATLFAENSVDAGSGGGVAVRPTGAALALAPQSETCVAKMRVVLDWRRNAQRCEPAGAIAGTQNVVTGTCDFILSTCVPLRELVGASRCDGCTCKENQLGAGESYFHIDRVADGALLPTEAATLFVGEPDAGAAKEFEYCLEAGEYEIKAYDRRGAAWFGGTLEATVSDFDGLEPFLHARAEWNSLGNETGPVRFGVGAVSSKDLAVRFVDNEAKEGGGAAVFWTVEAPAGLEAAATYSSGNAAGYGSFAATPATKLLINTTLTTVYAVPNAAGPAISAVLVDDYDHVVRADSTTAVNAEFFDDDQGEVQASGLVAVCAHGVATFDAITITGFPGDAHRLRFLAPSASLKTATLAVEMTPCPVGFVERADGETGVSCIACKYTEYYAGGSCVACPDGAACDRYEPVDALSAQVGYQLFTLETLPINRGYYRFYATSDKIYECADKSFCEADHCSCAGVGYEEAFRDPSQTHGARLCAANAEGPLCALCAAGYIPRPSSLGEGGGCAKCDGDSVLPIFFAVVLAAFLAALGITSVSALACAGVAKTRKRVVSASSFARSRWFVVAIVQVWYATSTVTRFTAIEDVHYPQPLETVLQYIGFFSLDLSFVIPSMQCYYSMSFFQVFLVWALFPAAFGAALALGVVAVAAGHVRGPPWPIKVWRHLTRTDAGRATRRTATSLFWLVLVLLHNYICSIIFTFYSCSDSFEVSENGREQWLTYDYEVRCGSDAYHHFKGAAAVLVVLYVLVVPASLVLKLKLNRRAGLPDGSLAFFTRHVRPAVWYYEIAALEVRLLICGALVPGTQRGLRLSILLVVCFGWATVTREMKPYINRGHMALVNFLQIFVLCCVALALVMYAELLSETASKVFAGVVSVISIAITVRLYSAFKCEEVTEVLDLLRSRRAFDRESFLRLHVGMNVRVLDDAVFAAALAILDEVGPEPKMAQDAGAAAMPGWDYLTTHLLPLRAVWTHAMPTRTLLATHEELLHADAALLARTRARCAPAADGVVYSGKQFAKDVDTVLGPLAQELRGDVVAATFARFAAAIPSSDLGDCFEPALRAVVAALVRDHAADEEEQGRAVAVGAPSPDSPPPESIRTGESAKKLAPLDLEGGSLPARGAVGDEPPLFHRLRLRLPGQHTARISPHNKEMRPSLRALVAQVAAPPAPREAQGAGRWHETFFDLAMHAHAANFKCWMVMEEAAAAILAEPDWGARVSALEDFSDGSDTVLQAPLQDPHLVAWTAKLGGEALREQIDEAVLPHVLRSVALDAHPAFIAALRALLCAPGGHCEDDGEEKSRPASPATSWASKCILYKSDLGTAVKSAARMSAKVEEYRTEDGSPEASAAWPHAARIMDPLRATVVCDDAEAIVRAYEALHGGNVSTAHPFRVIRLKNKLGLCTKPFNLHINCVFDRGDGAAPITTEVQIIPRAVNVVMGPSHMFYTLSRAPDAGALVQ
ncbi:hypothetical protein M885DRAFT_585041 [Pelagophyceae sp. CCMP2097]|nr:hypothetical protein M885DRAFT_585041 [Pelagophyceae sp. CCMP2097]